MRQGLKRERETHTQDFGKGNCTSRREHEEGKASPHSWKPPQGQRQGAALEPQKGMQKQVIRKQNGENSSQRQLPNSTTQSRSSLHPSCSKWNGRWVRRLRLRGLDPWVRTRIECCEEGASITQLRKSREKPGPLGEAKDSCHRDPLTPQGNRLQETTFLNAAGGMRGICELPNPEVDEPAWPPPKQARAWEVQPDTTAVYDPRGSNSSWLATAKARASAWGRGQHAATTNPTPEVAAATERWMGVRYCPHLPGSLCSLALLSDAGPRANSPRRAQDPPQTAAISCRPRSQQALPKSPKCGFHNRPSPQPQLSK